MKRLMLLTIFLLGLNACQTPGLDAPVIVRCQIISMTETDCLNLTTKEKTVMNTQDLLGYFAVSPEDEAKIENYLDALQTALKNCQDKVMYQCKP